MKFNLQLVRRLGLTTLCIGAAVTVVLGIEEVTAPRIDAATVADEIRTEAVRASNDPDGRPLPLVSSWTCGHYKADFMAGWRPDNQMRLIREGHHLLPWFNHPTGVVPEDPDDFQIRYYKDAIAKARELRLPLTFIASQWESGLSRPPYIDLPPMENPNVVTIEGEIQKRVSPFGPVESWSQIGAAFTDNPWMKQIQEWYPDPPLVIFLSNNEHSKLHWSEVEISQRYLDTFGPDRPPAFKREVVAERWIERYRALQQGMRDALKKNAWREHAVFVGYSVGDLAHFGRWGGWMHHSLYRPGRLNPLTDAWDGGSSSYYTHDWNSSTDYKVWSPQVEFMNNTLVKREAQLANPRFWYEISIWDGYHNNTEREKNYPSVRGVYRRAGQVYNPERYGGFVQFGMWLMRPRAVRDYRGWTEPWNERIDENGTMLTEGGRPYFMAIVEAVDRVHNNFTLREWWRHGERVVNPARLHPYQSHIPQEYRDEDRWFLLECDANSGPEALLKLETEISVFSLALVQGTVPERRWLLYAYSPLGDRHGVLVTIPGYQAVVITSTVGGSFYTVDEKTGAVTSVDGF